MSTILVERINDPEGNAAISGIQVGDHIVACNSEVVTSIAELLARMKEIDNDFVRLSIHRNERLVSIDIANGSLGARLRDDVFRISPHIMEQLNANESLEQIKLSTTSEVDGYEIIESCGLVTAECVQGIDAFTDIFASLTDCFGGRSGSLESELTDARDLCIRELRAKAVRAGGNAIVGLDLDYNEISGKNLSMLFLVANGTAVKVRPLSESHKTCPYCAEQVRKEAILCRYCRSEFSKM